LLTLYGFFKNHVVPAFNHGYAHGTPRRWLQVVKESIRTVLPQFSTRRMVKEYVKNVYLPALRQESVAR
jgi:starch phosphorylase